MSEFLRRRDETTAGITAPMPGQDNGPGSRVMQTEGSMTGSGSGERKRSWEERIAEALETLNEYKAGKATLEQRVIEAERYYRMHNWAGKRNVNKKWGVRTNSGWLFNSCMLKHSDAMDNYPEPNVLPQESSDEQTAKVLGQVLPCILEQNNYEEIWDKGWWDKIIKGTTVTCVSWDSAKQNGIGDVSLSRVDILNVFWDPGCEDIQESRNFYCVAMVDNDQLLEDYPELEQEGFSNNTGFTPGRYAWETTHNDAKRSAVVDWYYKRQGVLHYCKFVGSHVLYASEDDPEYAERGYYDHGLYPFIFDCMYQMEGSPAGFGQVDLCRDAQDYIDRLDSAILDSAIINARPKHFINNQGGVNEEEALDPEKPLVHVNGSGAISDSIMPYPKSELNSLYVSVESNKVAELREISGSTAAATGGTPAGVTAYSAIAAMQEVASKPSRDLVRAGYRRYKEICYMIIELLRQFYTEPRIFRVIGETGQQEFIPFDNTAIMPQAQPGILGTEFAERRPVFDIKVKPAKQTAYSRMAQNELAKELYGAGVFAPQNADQALAVLDMMEFEGKQKVEEKVRQNGTMYQMLQQLAMQVQQLQAMLGMAAAGGAGTPHQSAQPTASPQGEANSEPQTDSLGNEQQQGKRISRPRERAQAANQVE